MDTMIKKSAIHRYSLALVGLLCFVSLMAQNPSRGISFDVQLGAGYSSLSYKVNPMDDLSASTVGSYGLNAHLGINCFFSDYVGLSLGADVARYGSSLRLSGKQRYADVTDTDGERYTHILDIYSWCEQQQQIYLAPQLLLLATAPVGTVRLSFAVGVEYGFCLGASYSAKGDLEHTGFYGPWNLTLHDVPLHGFYRGSNPKPSGKLPEMQQLSLVARAGVLIPVARNLDLSVHALFKYSVLGGSKLNGAEANFGEAGGVSPIGFREEAKDVSPEVYEAHAFMPEYASLLSSPLTKGAYVPLWVGVEVGIRYTIPFSRRKYVCRCVIDD